MADNISHVVLLVVLQPGRLANYIATQLSKGGKHMIELLIWAVYLV